MPIWLLLKDVFSASRILHSSFHYCYILLHPPTRFSIIGLKHTQWVKIWRQTQPSERIEASFSAKCDSHKEVWPQPFLPHLFWPGRKEQLQRAWLPLPGSALAQVTWQVIRQEQGHSGQRRGDRVHSASGQPRIISFNSQSGLMG